MSFLPGSGTATAPARDRDVEAGVQVDLARHLLALGPTADAGYVVAALLAAVVVWGHVPGRDVLAALVAVFWASWMRRELRRRATTDPLDPDRVLAANRKGVVMVAAFWGIGILFIGPRLPSEVLAWLTVIFAGLVAAGTSTLLGDVRSYVFLNVLLFVPLLGAVWLSPDMHDKVGASLMIAVYAAIMARLFQRGHGMLTARLRDARLLARSEHAAAEAGRAVQRLARVVEATTDPVVIATRDLRMQYLNGAASGLLGVAPDAARGHGLLEFTAERFHDSLKREAVVALERERAWRGQFALRRADGSEVPLAVLALGHPETGPLEAISIVGRDVTAEVAARESLKAAREAAEQASDAKSAFLANTSHEIRTPLNGILGMVELLLDTDLSPEQRRSIQLIATSGETLLSTINDVLDLSKIEAGQLDIEQAAVDVHALTAEVARLFAARAQDKGIEIVADISGDVPQWITGDSHRLRQVLANLVSNAIKFTERGEVTVVLERMAGHDRRLALTVRDTGPGIPAAQLERIFQPFVQADVSTTRHHGGTGLGLSIARRLAELMGGGLTLTSLIGQGSAFRLELPLVAAEPAMVEVIRDFHGLRVLLVDDHEVNRRVLAGNLEALGCDVAVASGARSALEAARHAAGEGRPFGLLVTDLQMPGGDGFDLVRDLRRDASFQATPVVMLSSGERRGDAQRCRELEIAVFLQKPAPRAELASAIGMALGRTDPNLPAVAARPAAARQVRVLLAEDNSVNVEVATAVLRRRGHVVDVAADGLAAVAHAARSAYDIILMDIHLPEIDGIEATRRIRAAHGRSIPIIALTASVLADERKRCSEAGMDGFLAKPFRARELLDIVERSAASASAGGQALGAQAVSERAPPVDLPALRAVMAEADVPELADEILRVFVADYPARAESLAHAMATRDAAEIASVSHGMRSGAAHVHANALAALLAATETAARAGDLDVAVQRAREAGAEFGRVMAYLAAPGG